MSSSSSPTQPANAADTTTRRSRLRAWMGGERVLAVVAIVIAAVSLYLQARKSAPEVTITLESVQRIHPPNGIVGLTYDAIYKGEPISNVWALDVRMRNSGLATVVGQGEHANVIGGGLGLAFAEADRILEVHPLSNGFSPQCVVKRDRLVSLQFEQWKSGEEFLYRVFLTSLTNGTPDWPQVDVRALLGGDVHLYAGESLQPKRAQIADSLAPWLQDLLAIISRIAIVAWVLIMMLLIGLTIFEFARLRRWRRAYGARFEAHINTTAQLGPEVKAEILAQPWRFKGVLPEGILPVPVDEPIAATSGSLVRTLAVQVIILLVAVGLGVTVLDRWGWHS